MDPYMNCVSCCLENSKLVLIKRSPIEPTCINLDHAADIEMLSRNLQIKHHICPLYLDFFFQFSNIAICINWTNVCDSEYMLK